VCGVRGRFRLRRRLLGTRGLRAGKERQQQEKSRDQGSMEHGHADSNTLAGGRRPLPTRAPRRPTAAFHCVLRRVRVFAQLDACEFSRRVRESRRFARRAPRARRGSRFERTRRPRARR